MLQRSSERMEMVVDIYESVDAVRGHNPYLHSTDIKRDPDTAPHTGGDTACSRCYRVTAVCVALLCVLLLTAFTLLWFKYNNLNTDYSRLQTSNNNLTKERDQLQTSNNNLTKERDQLQTSNNNLTEEKKQLQTSYNTLIKERDHLQTSNNIPTIERNQLQRERDRYLRTLCDLYKEHKKCFVSSSSLYFMSNEYKSWDESREDCRKKGTDLVIINSREEQDFIIKQVNDRIQVWIGLSDRETEGEWKWVDGTPLTTAFWDKVEPNNGGGDEDCVEFYSLSNKNFWNDKKCSETLQWICEKHLSQ